MNTRKTIEEIKEEYEHKFLNIPGVEGIGIGKKDGKSVVKIYVDKMTKSLEDMIPPSIEGYPVIIEVTGEIHTLTFRKNPSL